MPKFSKNSLKKLEGVHPKLVTLMKQAIIDSPIDFSIVQGLRTAEYQHSLYQQGRTIPGKIVTQANGFDKKSNHQAKSDGNGWAIDFCPYIDGKLDWDNEKAFRTIANHILKTADEMGISISWGGDWMSFKDLPHIELCEDN